MSDPKVKDSMPVGLEVASAQLLADLKVHAKFMTKGAMAAILEWGGGGESPVLPKPLHFERRLESGFLHEIS